MWFSCEERRYGLAHAPIRQAVCKHRASCSLVLRRGGIAVCGIERVARSMRLYAALRVSLYAPVCAIERVARCMRVAA